MFKDIMSAAMNTKHTIELREPMELQALRDLLEQRVDVTTFGHPNVKVGFKPRIEYPKQGDTVPTVTVKDRRVTITAVTRGSTSSVQVGGFSRKLGKENRGKGLLKKTLASAEYFGELPKAVMEALADRSSRVRTQHPNRSEPGGVVRRVHTARKRVPRACRF